MQNYVYSIHDDKGRKREGFEEVAEVVTKYYHDKLGKQRIKKEEIDWDVMEKRPKLKVEQQLQLIGPFIEQQIKGAILTIPAVKSPGPDGYSSSFFKAS